MWCNCNLIVIGYDVIDPCLVLNTLPITYNNYNYYYNFCWHLIAHLQTDNYYNYYTYYHNNYYYSNYYFCLLSNTENSRKQNKVYLILPTITVSWCHCALEVCIHVMRYTNRRLYFYFFLFLLINTLSFHIIAEF